MPEKKTPIATKKNIIVQKSAPKRMSKPPVSKTNKAPEPSKPATPVRPAATARPEAPVRMSPPAKSAAARPAVAPSEAPKQLANFEAAMKLFHARKLKEARDLFQQAAQGPERDVANRARLHLTMCDRRLQQVTVTLKSAEEYYTYGIALINSRNLGEARAHLEKALEMAPDTEHIHYALALAQALGGDLNGAHENLRRAIELEPRNRLIARQDADFAHLANQPPFDALIYPEKKGW